MRGMKQLATNFSIPLQAGHALCLFGVILWATYIQPFPLSRCHPVRPIGCADIANFPLSTFADIGDIAEIGEIGHFPKEVGSSLRFNTLQMEYGLLF